MWRRESMVSTSLSSQVNDYSLWYVFCFEVSPCYVQILIYDSVAYVKNISNRKLNNRNKMLIIVFSI